MVRSGHRLTVAVVTLVAGALHGPAPVYAARMVAELRPSRIYLGTQTLLVVEVTDARDATVTLVWSDSYGVGERSVRIGSANRILWLAQPEGDTMFTIEPTAGTVRVCGLRNR